MLSYLRNPQFRWAVAAMVAVISISNILVMHQVDIQIGPVNFADFLTFGAFSYPVAFLVTDLTNRRFGPAGARMVVVCGFVVAVLFSIVLASPRIAVASGSAFLVAQFLDIAIFDKLRQGKWWHPPLFSSLVSSALDTVIFFGVTFAPLFAVLDTGLGREDGSLPLPVALLGFGPAVPHWTSLAFGDFLVKLLLTGLMLAPYKGLLGFMSGRTARA